MARRERLTVLFLLPNLEIGGSERVCLTMLAGLDRDRFAPELAVIAGPGPLSADVPPDVFVHYMHQSRVRFALFALVKHIWNRRPDVVFSSLGHLNLTLALIKPLLPAGIRLLARESNHPRAQNRLTPAPRLFDWLYARLLPRLDRIVAQTRAMKRELLGYRICGKKIVVIENPLDAERLDRLAADAPPVAVSASGRRLVAVGRFKQQKRFDFLLRSVALVPEIQLDLVGDGPQAPQLRALVAELGLADRVRFHGMLENPFPLVAGADLCVFTSDFEGTPNAGVEALGLGVPLLGRANPGLTDLIESGVNGLLVPASAGPDRFAAAISEALAVPFDRERIRTNARTRFALPRFIREVEAVVAGIAGAHHQP